MFQMWQTKTLSHRATNCRKSTNQKGNNLLIEEKMVEIPEESGEPMYNDY